MDGPATWTPSESATAVIAEQLDEDSARTVLDVLHGYGFRLVIAHSDAELADQETEPSVDTGSAVPQLTRLLTHSLAATRGLEEIRRSGFRLALHR